MNEWGRHLSGTQVAIVRTMPIVRQGIEATFVGTEFRSAEINESELREWARQGGSVLIEVHGASDLELIADLRSVSVDTVVITLVAPGSERLVEACLGAGANSAVHLESDTAGILLALRAAAGQLTVLPQSVGWRLTDGFLDRTHSLSEMEVEWLQWLAAGRTVRQVADAAGYSSREMFRLLNRCYRKLGEQSRIKALLKAARLGVI